MSRFDYYQQLKALARDMRSQYALTTPRVMRSDLRRIYRDQGIRIDLWPHRVRQLRGAYFNDDIGATVMLSKRLPDEPAIFTLAHELKHHLTDSSHPVLYCADTNVDEVLEIGAEVFAAEMIFPEQDFVSALTAMGITKDNFQADALVHLKRSLRTTLSYAGLVKRAEFLRYVARGALRGVKWKLREEQLYGEPVYKQILRRRRVTTSQ